MDISAIVFLCFAALMVITVLSVPAILLYVIYKYLSHKGYKVIGVMLISTVLGYCCYEVYTSISPTDNFYYEEFTEVTQRQIPKSAEILCKQASFPDFHGDYGSCSLIRLSKHDYNELLFSLKRDKNLTQTKEIVGSQEFDDVFGYKNEDDINVGFIRTIKNEEDHYLYIGFLKDLETIVVHVSVS